jgi:hypothetical protein
MISRHKARDMTAHEGIQRAQARRDEKEYLHTREASGLVDWEAHHRDDLSARWGVALHRPSSAVAQRNAQSTSAVFAWAAEAAVQVVLILATEPLTFAGQSCGRLNRRHDGKDE